MYGNVNGGMYGQNHNGGGFGTSGGMGGNFGQPPNPAQAQRPSSLSPAHMQPPHFQPLPQQIRPHTQQQQAHAPAGSESLNGPGFEQMASLVHNPMFSSMAANVTDWDAKKADVERNVTKLRFYFQVSNAYVLNKMKLIVFPWLHKDWSRRLSHEGQFLNPRDDINAPDLYIPAMSYVTFVVLTGIYYGHQGTFEPEKLGIVASSMLVWLILEVLVVFGGFYLLSVTANYSWLDIVSYCGYKYTAMIMALAAFMVGGITPYYCVMGYAGLAVVVFWLRTLRHVLNPAVPDSMHTHTNAKASNTFVLVISALQGAMIYFLTNL
ncbi:hypothetical protein SARC_06917 [Sphaeroforma arctica JP610]|uniref:Protein YIF1 n=1 Tax=Sphaeroforma arctica JP610 TaxID=667725 RepID=A0A0L0FVS0_9EUKA|nr:hypothetical protein SARC_06917 [Sphaeroforma arctica JP610]KNC80734.1 hypothetical protein SARC_06917 [Sphaeroforma arctica JP610]|eukprot:XP_014154636.1 hypothetical protein SARC_06917 [Sphaeroforma arctica JP610]